MTTDDRLVGREFVKQHRDMMQRLRRVVQLLEEERIEAAREAAKALDRIAGPHIEFEETVLYPIVGEARGKDYADQLYHEHRVTRDALHRLLTAAGNAALAPEDVQSIIEDLRVGLAHAASCGALLSHLETLAPEDQARTLAELQRIAANPKCWTDLPQAHHPEAP